MSFAQFEEFIFEKMSETGLPSLTVAIVEGDEITWTRAFGFRDLGRSIPATPATLYSVASVTKSFTCLAIMQLAEQGKLAVDDPVSQHIPFDIQPGGEPICIWHLMSHTSGIPALAYGTNAILALAGADVRRLPIAGYDEMLTFMRDADRWALASPGERWFYLDEGYVLLSYIIEVCSGMSFHDYLRDHVLAPLGMTRSMFTRAEFAADSDTATPYFPGPNGKPIPATYPLGLKGDGGLISNVLDLGKAISMYLSGGKVGGEQWLSRQSIEAMQVARAARSSETGPFGIERYGYGLTLYDDFLGHTLVGHSGSIGMSTSDLRMIPEKGIGIALLANCNGYALKQFSFFALAMLLGEDPTQTLPFVNQERTLGKLAGRYKAYKQTVEIEIRQVGSFLFLEMYGVTTPLVPDRIEADNCTFYTLQMGYKHIAEFRIRDGQIDLIYDHYLLLRKAG